jgi:hypothetical protein
MKQILITFLLILIIFPAEAQSKKRGKVKRKYRDVEQMSEASHRWFSEASYVMPGRFLFRVQVLK